MSLGKHKIARELDGHTVIPEGSPCRSLRCLGCEWYIIRDSGQVHAFRATVSNTPQPILMGGALLARSLQRVAKCSAWRRRGQFRRCRTTGMNVQIRRLHTEMGLDVLVINAMKGHRSELSISLVVMCEKWRIFSVLRCI